jgi:hypothetical protein
VDRIAADGISLIFDPACGVIDRLVITAEAGELQPLHRAPWLDSGETLPEHIAPVERRLAGDFFCAPFAQATQDVPIHGWAANGSWESAGIVGSADRSLSATYHLRQSVSGARLTKHLTLCAGHPVVYQSHVFQGGEGHIPVAHHAMLHVPGGAQLSFSPKGAGRTPPAAPETDPARGRSILAYPQLFDALAAVRCADESVTDASFYPFARRHEDVIVLSEMPGGVLGWSAALATRDGFLFFAIKDARLLPHTVLWMSNGGRDYPPWNGRHLAVIGIEEGAVGLHLPAGHCGGDDVSAAGLPTGLSLDESRTTTIRYAFGAVPAPQDWTRVSDIRVTADSLTLTDTGGDTRTVPFLGEHFSEIP